MKMEQQVAFDLPNYSGDTAFLYDGQLSGSRSQLVTFRWEPVLDRQASALEGRPVYKKTEYVTIQGKGEALQIIDREATIADKRRFVHQYEAFKRNQAYVPDGTPVDLLFSTEPNVTAILKSNGIHVVEDLVRISANAIDTLGLGAQEWVNRGKNYLEMAKKGVDFHQMKQMEEKHEREVTSLRNEIADLINRMDTMRQNMIENVPAYARQVIEEGAAQASLPNTPARAMPQVPLKDPRAWNAPSAGMLDSEERRDTIRQNLKNKSRTRLGGDVEFADK
jgi:hypothetical protein